MTTQRIASPDFAQLRAADVMTLDPVVARVDDPLEKAESLMAGYRVSGLPVVAADGHLVGVISRTDLVSDGSPTLSALLRGNAGRIKVGELMSVPAVTVPMTATLVEAAQVMHEARVHRVVITDGDNRPIGVLSASDYVAVVAGA